MHLITMGLDLYGWFIGWYDTYWPIFWSSGISILTLWSSPVSSVLLCRRWSQCGFRQWKGFTLLLSKSYPLPGFVGALFSPRLGSWVIACNCSSIITILLLIASMYPYKSSHWTTTLKEWPLLLMQFIIKIGIPTSVYGIGVVDWHKWWLFLYTNSTNLVHRLTMLE